MFATLEAHFVNWAKSVDASVIEHARHFLEFAKNEEARIAAEVEHLKSIGYQVVKDGTQL